MATIGSLIVNVGAKTESLSKAMKDAQKTIDRFKRSAEKSLQNIGKTSANALKWISGGLVAGAALSVKAYAEQERAEVALKSAMQTHGMAVERNFERYARFASQIQAVTVHGDEAVLALMTQAINYGLTGDRAQYATMQAIGLAQALGMDVNMALKMSSMALQGNFDMLNRYIPALKNTTDASAKMALVQKVANAGFEQAKSYGKTVGGSLIMLKNAFGDLAETIGKKILGNIGDVNSIFGWLLLRVQALSIWVRNLNDRQIEIVMSLAKYALGALAFMALLPKIISGIRMLIGMYHALAAAKALANPAVGIAGIAAMGAVAAVGAIAMYKVGEAIDEFSGSWDNAMAEAKEQMKDLASGNGLQKEQQKGDVQAQSQVKIMQQQLEIQKQQLEYQKMALKQSGSEKPWQYTAQVLAARI